LPLLRSALRQIESSRGAYRRVHRLIGGEVKQEHLVSLERA
jgi:hypothetical protein